MAADQSVTGFIGTRRVATGSLANVARRAFDQASASDRIAFFDDRTGRAVDIDLRDVRRAEEAAPAETAAPAARAPGRPKLGVVAREITLLPRHWEWLSRQPGGASVALRKLVEEARRAHAGEDIRRERRDAAYAFMSAMAGDLVGFEEASRALFAADATRFRAILAGWPPDVAAHASKLAAPAFGETSGDA